MKLTTEEKISGSIGVIALIAFVILICHITKQTYKEHYVVYPVGTCIAQRNPSEKEAWEKKEGAHDYKYIEIIIEVGKEKYRVIEMKETETVDKETGLKLEFRYKYLNEPSETRKSYVATDWIKIDCHTLDEVK
jgi:hypothetical protein